MDIEKARQYILKKLEDELDKTLYYHSIDHTIDVCSSALSIAREENVHPTDMALLETAALYHDSGITVIYKGHEMASAKIAREVLPGFGYSNQDIKKIEKMIIATQLPQKPVDKLSEILCDADLDYLGRDDFYINALKLYREWNELGIKMSLKEWYQLQVDFLKSHTYFTDTTIKRRQKKKNFHLNQVKELLNLNSD